ncbi:MAG: hypothetical protein MUP69_06065 [Candidatus Atribacteria bacterium]|nr:hypothetical protein [Candidatus Atribacteria bacterium]
MNKYKITQKIKTLAHLLQPFDCEEFHFKQWGPTVKDGPTGHAWIADKLIEAGDIVKANNKFRKDLFKIITQCCLVSQCYFRMISEPFMVLKQNNNPNNIFYLYHTNERMAVSLPFGKEEIESVKHLKSFPRKGAFMYINESTNATSFYSRLAMLIIALESIAGEKSISVTDKDYIKNDILKDNVLFDKIFQYETGIRNKIFHGKEVEIKDNYVKKIYESIVKYFNTKYHTTINLNVVHPQRTFSGSINLVERFIQLADKTVCLDFKRIIEEFDKDINISDFITLKSFDFKNY